MVRANITVAIGRGDVIVIICTVKRSQESIGSINAVIILNRMINSCLFIFGLI